MSPVRRRERRQKTDRLPQQSSGSSPRSFGAFAAPLALTAALLALTLLARVRADQVLTWSFWGAAAVLLAWQALLGVRARRESVPTLRLARPRAQHYIQSLCQYFFAITPVTVAAAATLFGASALYVAATGVPYFVDSDIPSAVFLGLHLLVTDPSTSPRTPLGRGTFGVLYGLGAFALYAILGALGLPTFYDKLLCVPLLNLAVPGIDRAVRSIGARPILSRLGLDAPRARANLAHMGAWVVLFGAMSALGATDGMHRGDSLPFWEQACAANRPQACQRLLRIEASYCNDNAGWACNELGRHHVEGRLVAAAANTLASPPASLISVFSHSKSSRVPGVSGTT